VSNPGPEVLHSGICIPNSELSGSEMLSMSQPSTSAIGLRLTANGSVQLCRNRISAPIAVSRKRLAALGWSANWKTSYFLTSRMMAVG
jgi:hypothetical protein